MPALCNLFPPGPIAIDRNSHGIKSKSVNRLRTTGRPGDAGGEHAADSGKANVTHMTSLRDSEEAKARRASLLARKIAQADEGRLAMADYQQKQQATLDRTAKLKSLRLAQEAAIVPEPPNPARARRKKSDAVLASISLPRLLVRL